MELVWSRFALSDLDGIFSYIEAENPRAAVHVDEQIADAARRLLDFPDSGRPGARRWHARVGHPAHTYVAAYLVDGDTVRIYCVLHGAQMWPDELTNDDWGRLHAVILRPELDLFFLNWMSRSQSDYDNLH
ncbi:MULTISPECIES: type II toxin-antitoxin system RelE/ParE family toxin [Bradyrhizobium]|uniref:type II toxin-antitoxin system RelE/ParE family toxin n=1 Tax=Bradyrhizobium TaxID=374 RepID=UPI000D399B2A|nr:MULTISPECIES: type II toxin-antitoxin system RelE/ParE family toxin [Bradyrhizobium]WOH52394.1 type II toxin-antitoxin system RelE/ParE family toxin [Bradyrhizobium sp. sBnM-33]